jgi:hypothetical protein
MSKLIKEPLLRKDLPTVDKITPEEFSKLTLRQRYQVHFDGLSSGGRSVAHVFPLFRAYLLIGLYWFIGFYVIAWATGPLLNNLTGKGGEWYLLGDLFSLGNIKRFILYNVFHGVTGFGATCGPLGAKDKLGHGAMMYHCTTRGTLASPLFPAVVRIFQKTPAKRGPLGVAAYVCYCLALVWGIIFPTFISMYIINATYFVACIFDFNIFFASRGEHYGYHMFCLMFPDWLAGCQWSQAMMWIMCGFSKLGPWFKYVIQVLVQDGAWTPFVNPLFMSRLFRKDHDGGDYNPSLFARLLSHCGCLGEWVFPLCCMAVPGTIVNQVGVFGMILYHAIIWLTLPAASVFEWQYYTQIMTYLLYGTAAYNFNVLNHCIHDFGIGFGMGIPYSPTLRVFLVIVLIVIPVIGQINPKLVPFMMAFRQYAGNWRTGWWIVSKEAKTKIEKLVTYNSIYRDQGFEYGLAASFMVVPQFRGIFSVMEKFFEDSGSSPNDFDFIFSFFMENAIFGWGIGLGWMWNRECFREAVVEICGLEPGDCYVLQMEPVSSLPPHTLNYRLMDVAKGPLDAEVYVTMPYSELEGTHPLECIIKPERMSKGKSIRGTFLSTYY